MDGDKDDDSLKNVISSNNLKGINLTIDYFERKNRHITITRKKIDNLSKTFSLINPFSKNNILKTENENENPRKLRNEFKDKEYNRTNLDKHTNYVFDGINLIKSSSNLNNYYFNNLFF